MKNLKFKIAVVLFLFGVSVLIFIRQRELPEKIVPEAVNSNLLQARDTALVDSSYFDALEKQGVPREIVEDGGPGFYRVQEERPFEVVQSSDLFEWTAEDGTSSETIKILTNNPIQEESFHFQNQYVERRQLIYFAEEKVQIQHQEILSGTRSEVTFPGFDGEEMGVAVLGAQIEDSEITGTADISGVWHGYLTSQHTQEEIDAYRVANPQDRPDPEVFVVMYGDDWSISIARKEEGKTYYYSNRLNGEWILGQHDNYKEQSVIQPSTTLPSPHDVGEIQQKEL